MQLALKASCVTSLLQTIFCITRHGHEICLTLLAFLSHRVSPIFMLHFVEGLPRDDLQHYSFHFEGCLYQITSVIQYQANNHFITWILDADGECLNLFLYDNRHRG